MKLRALITLAAVLLAPSFSLAQSSPSTSTASPAWIPAQQSAATPDATPPAAPQQQDAPKDATAPQQGAATPDATAPQQGSTTPEATPAPAETPSASEQPKDAPKAKHDGGKDDVEDIGNRKVGKGGSLGNWYSIEKEIRLGKSLAAQVDQTAKMVTDPVITEYVNRIGQNLVRNSDARVPFTIKVIDSDDINAFALPGGYFYVNTGLILAADEEAELAGVMAHEIAHVAARHATRQATRAQWANIATIPLIFVGGGIGYAARGVASLALPMTFLKFSRGFEAEADYLGLQYMYAAGYDPQAFINFFEKLQAKEKKKPGTLVKAFSTHPQNPERIAASQKEINNVLPPKPQYIVTTSEFDEVKSRLASIENKHKVIDDRTDRPTLRRTAQKTDENKDGSEKDKDKPDDDRPTLKRRD